MNDQENVLKERGPGRPKQLLENITKTTLTISVDQIYWLDMLCAEIRRKSRSVIDRGTIIRALITALEHSRIDLSHVTNENDITSIVLQKLQQ